ncbi:MAG: sugar transferase [Caldilineaceae bacterium]|nr:sugar transferase [Caldilineaceae bacterium]
MIGKSETVQLDLLKQARFLHDAQPFYRRLYKGALLLGDGVMLILAFWLAYILRFELGLTISPEVVPLPQQYIFLVMILIPLWLPLFYLLRLYDYDILLGGTMEYARVYNACASGMMLVIIVSFIAPGFVISRGWLLLSWCLSSVLICSARLFLRRMVYAQWRFGRFLTPTLIIGTNQEAVLLASKLGAGTSTGLQLLGFVSEQGEVATGQRLPDLNGLPIFGSFESIPSLIKQRCVRQLIVASTAVSREQLLDVFHQVGSEREVEIHLSSGVYEILTTNMHVAYKAQIPLMTLSRLRLSRLEVVLKTALDYSLILVSLPFLLPIMAVIALLIKLDSPGPVFYRRRVLGIGGREFDAFKFRTMVVNGDEVLANYPALQEELATTHKLKHDPRVTRMGRILRQLSLDELPQLFNVLLGQMSLVGPRMISLEEAKEYGRMKLNLLTVKPGLTGLWQVSGRSDLSYEERVRLDMDYVRNYSIWLDLQILFFQTLPVVLKGHGAY